MKKVKGKVKEKVFEDVLKIMKPYIGLPKEIYVLSIARLINAMGLFVFPLLTFILTQKIGLSEEQTGLWMSISGLLWAPASIIGGKLTDIIGRKKIIIVFDSLAALGFVACAFTEPSMEMVYLIMISSMFLGFTEPAHGALIADVTTPENRDGAYSLSYLGFNIGYAIGPLIGGYLFSKDLLTLLFLIDALTAFIAVSLVVFFIKETINRTKEELGENRKLEKSAEGSIFKILYDRPILIFFSLIMFGYNFTYAQWGFLMPLHLGAKYGEQGSLIYGTLSGFNAILVVSFTALINTSLHKKSNLRKIVYGGILYTFGLGLLGFINIKSAFFISVFIFTLGEMVVTISFMPFISNHTPASHRGRMNSILPIIMGAGYALAPYTTGKALKYISMESAWKIVGVIIAISTGFMMLLEKMDNKNSYREVLNDTDKDVV